MKQTEGACIYCGQIQMLAVPDNFTEEDINLEVTKRCKCTEAEVYTRREEQIAGAERAIKDIFKDYDNLNEVKDYLITAARPVAENKFSKISISKSNYTASMKPGKDAIKISLKFTEEQTKEI